MTHGVTPRMLIAPRNPRRLYLDDSHTSRHIRTHERIYGRILTARENTRDLFFFRASVHSGPPFERISPSLELASLAFNGKPQSISLDSLNTSDTRPKPGHSFVPRNAAFTTGVFFSREHLGK